MVKSKKSINISNDDDDEDDEDNVNKEYNDTPFELSVYLKPNIYHLKITKNQYDEYSLQYNEMVSFFYLIGNFLKLLKLFYSRALLLYQTW